MTAMQRLAQAKGRRPTRQMALDDNVPLTAWDATFFAGTPDIQLLQLPVLRQCAGSVRTPQAQLRGLLPSGHNANMSYMVVGMIPVVPGENAEFLQIRQANGDLGLQFLSDTSPLVLLPPQGIAQPRGAQDLANKCVVGLVKLLQKSVPNFWRGPWDVTDLGDFLQDQYALTTDAVLFLTGALRFAMLISQGLFPHDVYLAYVRTPAELEGRVWL